MTEPLDIHRLAAWMDDAGLPGKGETLNTRFLSGGTQNVIHEIIRGDARCVLRMPPPGAPPDRDKGILREWRIIEAMLSLSPRRSLMSRSAPTPRSSGVLST